MLLSEWRVLFGDEDMRLQLHSAEKTQIILTWKIFREIILLLICEKVNFAEKWSEVT